LIDTEIYTSIKQRFQAYPWTPASDTHCMRLSSWTHARRPCITRTLPYLAGSRQASCIYRQQDGRTLYFIQTLCFKQCRNL